MRAVRVSETRRRERIASATHADRGRRERNGSAPIIPMPLFGRKTTPGFSSPSTTTQYEEIRVGLNKPPDGIVKTLTGITCADVKKGDGPQHPFVWGMERGTLAYGHVLDGDRIVSINDVKPKTAKEASKIIRNTTGALNLVLLRPDDMKRAREMSLTEPSPYERALADSMESTKLDEDEELQAALARSRDELMHRSEGVDDAGGGAGFQQSSSLYPSGTIHGAPSSSSTPSSGAGTGIFPRREEEPPTRSSGKGKIPASNNDFAGPPPTEQFAPPDYRSLEEKTSGMTEV